MDKCKLICNTLTKWQKAISENCPSAGFLFQSMVMAMADDGKLDRTHEQMADMTGLSRSSVIRYVAALEAIGAIRVHRQKNGRKNDVNIYQVDVPDWNADVSNCDTHVSDCDTEEAAVRAGDVSNWNTYDSMIHDMNDDIYNYNDSGEFSGTANEGRDRNEEQDAKIQFLEEHGVQGVNVQRIAEKYPLELIKEKFAMAADASNPVGYAIASLKNEGKSPGKVYRPQKTTKRELPTSESAWFSVPEADGRKYIRGEYANSIEW